MDQWKGHALYYFPSVSFTEQIYKVKPSNVCAIRYCLPNGCLSSLDSPTESVSNAANRPAVGNILGLYCRIENRRGVDQHHMKALVDILAPDVTQGPCPPPPHGCKKMLSMSRMIYSTVDALQSGVDDCIQDWMVCDHFLLLPLSRTG